ELMKELDGDGAFADCRGDTLHGAVSDVARGEHSRHARLQEKRTAIARQCATLRDIPSREDESMLIAFDIRWKPVGVRLGSDQEEKRIRRDRVFSLRLDVAQHQMLETSVAATAHDLASEPRLDVVGRLDLAHEVFGHPGAERIGPHYQ